jgi:1-deoxy-D-xylulose-5-phosphate synthase
MAAADERLVGITPAMREGSGLVRFSQEFPQRYFDVAIAEQHAVTLAAGMACEGMKPVVAIYSTFLQRAYDQLIHDVALQNLDVLFAIDRAGLVGRRRPDPRRQLRPELPALHSQHGGDGAFRRNECASMLTTGFLFNGPAAVRYPRGSGPGAAIEAGAGHLADRQGKLRRRGRGLALLAFGQRWSHPRNGSDRHSTRPWSTCASSSRWTRN